MENFNIYKDIAERTDGDIYVGVVGPVRTGKSTFIKRFMDIMVIPNIDNPHKKERAKDELPQSSSGKTIHTTEPKFVPNEAVDISLEDSIKLKVRLVDCVGYIVKSALGYVEGDKPKMVSTPWFDHEIPFEKAAEIGTKKVIDEHSTIGLVVTTDGSITDIPREEYVEAEERVVKELKEIKKPFIIILNSAHASDPNTLQLKDELEKKYDVSVQVLDVQNMMGEDIIKVFSKVLKEFPIKEINIDMPEWIEKLSAKHWLKDNFLNIVKEICIKVNKIRDISKVIESYSDMDYLERADMTEMDMGSGVGRIVFTPKSGMFYKVLSEECECDIDGENKLLSIMKEMHEAKVQYDRISDALRDVREKGYGLVAPQLAEMKLEEPKIVKNGTRYEVKLKASAPSFHFIRADIETEVSPILGSERESEELVRSLLEQFENDPSEIWESNMFGKSLEVLVKEGLQKKLYKMPDDVQAKIQKTLEKIINEGNGGLICIIL